MPYWIHYSTNNWQPATSRNTLEEARRVAEKEKSNWQQWHGRLVHWRIYYGRVLAATSELDKSQVGKGTP